MKPILALGAMLCMAASTPLLAQELPTGLHGVKIAVADFEKTTRFYEILGMAPGTKYNPREWELRWAGPARGSVLIMVKDGGGRPAVSKGGAFLMVTVADVLAIVNRLKAAGFTIVSEPRMGSRSTIAFVADPDGNNVELIGGPRPVN